MALDFTYTPVVSDSASSYTVTVSGKQGASNDIICWIKVNGVVVSTMSGTGTILYHTGVTATEIYDNAKDKTKVNAISIVVNELDSFGTVLQTKTKYADVVINARNSALVTTANIIDINLADPANLAASWTRPHAIFRARLKLYVYNGSTYINIFNRAEFGSIGPNTTMDLRNVAGTDYQSDILAVMADGVSPRNYKLELYTMLDYDTIQDVGVLNDSDIITNGMVYSGFGGKIKVFGTSFLAKPIKVWTGTVWSEKPIKHWNGAVWVKSKN